MIQADEGAQTMENVILIIHLILALGLIGVVIVGGVAPVVTPGSTMGAISSRMRAARAPARCIPAKLSGSKMRMPSLVRRLCVRSSTCKTFPSRAI